jgi:hypothetical protein
MLLPLLAALVSFAADPASPFDRGGPMPAHGAAVAADPFEWRVSPPALVGEEPGELLLRLQVPDGFQLYRDQLRVIVADPGTLSVGSPTVPVGTYMEPLDPDAPRREVLTGEVVVSLLVSATELTPPGLAIVELFVATIGMGVLGIGLYAVAVARLRTWGEGA